MTHIPEDEPLAMAATRSQLGLLRELATLLAQAHLRFWLRGGWAVDFLVGQITRPHSDLDMVTWKRHAPRVRRLLAASGFGLERDLGMQMDFAKGGQTVSVVYLARNGVRQIVVPELPDWVWLPRVLAEPFYTLEGITSRVLSPQQLLADLEGYHAWSGRPPRPKDVQTIALLRQLVRDGEQRRGRW